jgi:hypothetical protein
MRRSLTLLLLSVAVLLQAACHRAPVVDAGLTDAGQNDAGQPRPPPTSPTVHRYGSSAGHIKRQVNFIDGAGIASTVVDNDTTGQADVTIASTVTGGVSSVTGAGTVSCSPTTGPVVCTGSSGFSCSNLGSCTGNQLPLTGLAAPCNPANAKLMTWTGNVNGPQWEELGGGGDIGFTTPIPGVCGTDLFIVSRIQGQTVVFTSPQNGQVLGFDSSLHIVNTNTNLPATCFNIGSLTQSAANLCQNITSCTLTVPPGASIVSVKVDFRMHNPDVLAADDTVGVATSASTCFSGSDIVTVAANPGSGNSTGRTSATIVYQFQGLSPGSFTAFANAQSNTQTFTTGASLEAMVVR